MTADRFAVLFERPGLDASFLGRLRDWIREAPAPDLYRINLPARAPQWNVPLPQAVTHFLHLTKAGGACATSPRPTSRSTSAPRFRPGGPIQP